MKLAVLALALLPACASLQQQADRAFAAGDYEAADALYGRLAEPSQQDAARTAELRVMFAQAEIMTDLVAHANQLASVLAQRTSWQLALDPAFAVDVRLEVDSTASRVQADIASRLDAPMIAEQLASHFGWLLVQPELSATAARIHEQVLAAGQARCAALPADSPFASLLAERYCAHFGVARAGKPLPGAAGSLAVTGAIAGETAPQTQRLARLLDSALRASPWFVAGGPALSAHVDGTLAAALDAHPVERTTSWTEQEYYTDYENQWEQYDETYTDTETYSEIAPDTIGTGSHVELKTRTVEKTRPSFHWVQEPVRKVRDVQHELTYDAIARHGRYAAQLAVRIDGLDLATSTSAAFDRAGDDTDENAPDAGVTLTRANLPTQDDFASEEHDALANRLRVALTTAYRDRYCSATTFTAENATACIHADPAAAPPAAHAALARELGAEESLVAPLLR